jgi:Flp pilus assembly protein TadD
LPRALADAKYNPGFVYLQQLKVEEATALFQQSQMGKILVDRGELNDAVEHLETATRLGPQSDHMHCQAAYRKESRAADADRELGIYKELKAKHRERDRAAIPPVQSP